MLREKSKDIFCRNYNLSYHECFKLSLTIGVC